MVEDSDVYGPVLDLYVDLLALEPAVQWWEALRLRTLRQVPERITVANPRIWQRTEAAFIEGKADRWDEQHAATHLLFDIWLWLSDCYDGSSESPFATLADLTQNTPSVPLRVAHCLRDLAHGNESRRDDLVAMVESDDAACRDLFQDAFWIDRND